MADDKLRLVLFGAPGVGKGVQGDLLQRRFGIPRISTGDILRRAMSNDDPESRQAAEYVSSGELVPDDLIDRLMDKRLGEADCQDGFILDGFPRTLGQAMHLETFLQHSELALTHVIDIEVDAGVVIDRLQYRRVCIKCGKVFNEKTDPPPAGGICDDGGVIVHRDDDKPDTIRHRLEVYLKETAPLKQFYEERKQLLVVNGNQDIKAVHEEIVAHLEVPTP